MVTSEATRIVLIEDNPADVFLIKEALKVHGIHHQLEWFVDGESAVNHVERLGPASDPPELILLDLNLPKLDGKQVLARIRRHPQLAKTIVAILTSSNSLNDRQETARLGANYYIQKPPTLDEFMGLGGTIKSLLGRA